MLKNGYSAYPHILKTSHNHLIFLILRDHTKVRRASILTGDYHLSKRYTQLLFADFFNLSVSVGTVSNAGATVSEALKAPVEEAKEYIKKQPNVNADETGHKQQGKKMWMWLAATA